MTSRGASSTQLSALLERPAATQANGTGPSSRPTAGGAASGTEFQSLLSERRGAHPPAGSEDANSSRQSSRGESRDADKRKSHEAVDDASNQGTANAGASPVNF